MGFARRMRRKGIAATHAFDIETWVYKKPPAGPRERPSKLYDHPQSNRITEKDPVAPSAVWAAWDGEYVKDFYWIRYKDGEHAVKCWPNAGYMNSMDGSGRTWSPDPDVFEVALVVGDSLSERGR